MAIINKASMVLLMLFVVATISDAARFDSPLELNKYSERQQFCSTCECTEESGVTTCRRHERKIDSCPLVCGEFCICTLSFPATCICNYEVESCSPPACSSASLAIGFDDLLVRRQVKP